MLIKIFAFTSIIISMLTFYSCSSSEKLIIEDQWSLDLRKGGCMDVCTAYSILINNKGEYVYTGRFMVKHRGRKKGEIKVEKFKELKILLTNIDWANLKSNYENPALDSQINTVKYNSESIQKEIIYNQIAPQELRILEKFINNLIDQDDF